jgi:hypothetical protein
MVLWKYGVRSFLQKYGIILYFLFCGVVYNRFRHWLKCHQLLSQKRLWCLPRTTCLNCSILDASLPFGVLYPYLEVSVLSRRTFPSPTCGRVTPTFYPREGDLTRSRSHHLKADFRRNSKDISNLVES